MSETPQGPRMEDLPARTAEGELTDEELEFVVGGLTRPWVEPLLPWERPATTP